MDRIKEATTDEEILACFPTYSVLQPHIKFEEYLARIRLQQTEGYHLMYLDDPEDPIPRSILAYRSWNCFVTGKTFYVEDVITAPEARGKGYAQILMDWVKKYAIENDYNYITLVTGYTRLDAHRFYLKNGFNLMAHHMAQHFKDH